MTAIVIAIAEINFPLGQLVITANARTMLAPENIQQGLSRHAAGDWGELCQFDWEQNDLAVMNGGRLLSNYTTRSGNAFWIITEHDRSVTTILLPSDY